MIFDNENHQIFSLKHFQKSCKQDNRIYKKTYKENYHPANFPSLSFLGKIFKEIILQDAINLFSENNFLEGKNVFAYQKKQEHIKSFNYVVEQMRNTTPSGKYVKW